MTQPISRRQLHPEGSRTDAALTDAIEAAEHIAMCNKRQCKACHSDARLIVSNLRALHDDPVESVSDGEKQLLLDWIEGALVARRTEVAYQARDIARRLVGPPKRNSPDAQAGAIGEPVATCANCDSVMPHGCAGTFKDELECALKGGPTYTAPQPPSAPSQSGEVAQLQGELARLRGERDSAKDAAIESYTLFAAARDERDKLRDQLAALQAQGKDAARYQQVRSHDDLYIHVGAMHANHGESLGFDTLDEWADAAIAQESRQGADLIP